jgi:hypothetical protein
MNSLDRYIKSTILCDFDQSPQIKVTAQKLTSQLREKQEIIDRIYCFVKELPYGLEDWDIRASNTLAKGWGMCLGKTNLMVAMLRSVGIPARYKILKVVSDNRLWNWITGHDVELAVKMGNPLPERDHVVSEVYLHYWEEFDPSRDTLLDIGMQKLGIALSNSTNRTLSSPPLILASIDEWATIRQQSRRFREDRQLIFTRINNHFDKIRAFSKQKIAT